MGKRTERTCAYCAESIKFDRNNIKGIVRYKDGKYYHTDCFIDKAQKGIYKNNSRSDSWRKALEDLKYYEELAKEKIVGAKKDTDQLDAWLKEHYKLVTTPSSRFWSEIREIGNGFYRRKRCVPVDIQTLTEAWEWAQPNLDKIAAKKEDLSQGIYGEKRLFYDLAVLVGKMPYFFASKKKQKRAASDMVNNTALDEIDMSKIATSNKVNTRKDISDITDDLFVE